MIQIPLTQLRHLLGFAVQCLRIPLPYGVRESF